MYESFKGGRASFWVQAACFGPLFTQCIDISLATFDCSPPHNAEIFTSTHAVIGQQNILTGCCSQSSEPPLRLCFWLSCGKNWVNWSFNSKSTIQISINKIQVGGGERTITASNHVTLLLHLFKKQNNKNCLKQIAKYRYFMQFQKEKKNKTLVTN